MASGDGNEEGEVMRCDRFWRGRGGGGEVVPRRQRRMIQRRAVRRWRSGRSKEVAGV
jgi:hypothetical protein